MSFIDLVYPKQCVGCRKKGRFFCHKCIKLVRLRENLVCPECNRRSIGGVVHYGCRQEFSLDGLVSLFSYRGMVRLGVQELKYRMIKEIEKEFVGIFSAAIKEKIKSGQARELVKFLKSRPVIVPVPLYWRRENWRGFNQAEVVVKMLTRGFSLKMIEDWIVRVRKTKSQMRLSKGERRENVKGVFRVKDNRKIENVLLVDDVWTTGATMRAVGEVLKKAGVKQVWGLTLAR